MTDHTETPEAGRLAQIRTRVEAATEGPWTRSPLDYADRERDDFLGHALEGPPEADRAAFARRADAEFAAHAREDVPWLLDQMEELLEELDGRDAEARERWIARQEEQLGIKWAEFRAGRWEMDLAAGREFAAAYVAAARALLGEAPNYSETKLEFDVKIAESPEAYTLVVQRHGPGAMTPHEARQKAERERDAAQAVVARVRDAVMNQSATVDLTQAILDALDGTQQADDDTEDGAL